MSPLALVKPLPNAPSDAEKRGKSARIPEEMLKCTYRPPDADFYCWRFRIWYNTLDCAYRTKHRTYSGCSRCAQGDFNLKSRRPDLPTAPLRGGREP